MSPCVVSITGNKWEKTNKQTSMPFLGGEVILLYWEENRALDEFYKIFIVSNVFKSMKQVGWSASHSIKEMSSVILEEICFKTIHA